MNEEALQRYTAVAIALHWLVLLLVAAMVCVGLYMTELPRGPARSEFFALHKSLGLTTLLVVTARLAWRLGHAPPPLPLLLPAWQQRLAAWNHALLYLLLFAQPLSGYLSSSFSGYKTSFWGIPLPHWGSKQPALNEFFSSCHEAGLICLLLLVGLHLCAVVWHARRHRAARVLQRMLPGGPGS